MKYRKKPIVIEAIQWSPNEKGFMFWGKEFAKILTFEKPKEVMETAMERL